MADRVSLNSSSTMAPTTSPLLEPAYTCGTHISVFDIGDDSTFISTLDPSASEFVPSFYAIEDDSEEARRSTCATCALLY